MKFFISRDFKPANTKDKDNNYDDDDDEEDKDKDVFFCISGWFLLDFSLSNASLRGSHSLRALWARRTKSSRHEGPKAGPKGCQLEAQDL